MKQLLDLAVKENVRLNQNYCLLKLSTVDGSKLPEMYPGQFVEVRVSNSPSTFLRRPISVNFVDKDKNELWLLIQIVGDGTKQMSLFQIGELISVILPLGNSFTLPSDPVAFSKNYLLVGGGVGTAPMLYLGAKLKESGITPHFLLGARSKNDILQLEEFEKYGNVFCTTEDGSYGEKGYVTNHSLLSEKKFDMIFTCGPKPMMMAVAKFAHQNNTPCEVSLENTMACGFGVCLCCVEGTKNGNVCVCTEGPVFNIDKLTWIN